MLYANALGYTGRRFGSVIYATNITGQKKKNENSGVQINRSDRARFFFPVNGTLIQRETRTSHLSFKSLNASEFTERARNA